ncbi:hypothetical protein Riv7116_1699 [Rivularia sp. PCC 7116]|uniref:hypothetical protein n=1 Tax=Rivularia sp. PCC 7116 TaxID=373994 RepID=UPI00029F4CCA|nr:hypothetical protein [Rivularia sp. PCC 7116]AFY54247.1 hypothetical protein Riv7116_1699 [Rivularia sp. PCC 7116]
MTDVSSNWQDSLNTGLLNRLNRPLNQPGMMKISMSQRIINRCDRLLNRLPLLGQQIQRWGNVNTGVSNDVPIVYAQPVSATNQSGIESGENKFTSTSPVIQRKEKPIDNITPSLNLENQINQTSISSSQIPVVSSQAISEQLTESEEMPLQSNTKKENNSVPLIQRKSDNSQSSTIKSVDNIKNSENITPALGLENHNNQINQTSISSPQIPVVSSQAISEQITETGEMPLLQSFISASQQLPIVQIKQQNSDLFSSQLPVTNPLNTFTNSKQTQLENNSENIIYSKQENLGTEINLTNLPIVTTQPSTDKNNSIKKETSLNRNYSNSQKNHHLPVVTITPSINTPERNQSLPLTKNYSSSQITNNSQPNLSNNNSSSLPKVLPLPSPPAETIVSPLANQSNSNNLKKIDVDTIVNQVERKLMRRLVIESERRGKTR